MSRTRQHIEEWTFWILFCGFILGVALLAASCAPQVPKVVEVPVLVHPQLNVNPKPLLPISHLGQQSQSQDIARAYAATVRIQEDYENYLLSLLK